jgi:hypothetical protein
VAAIVVGTDPIQDIIAAGVLAIAYLGYRNGRKLNEVHGLVNQQLTDSQKRGDDAVADAAQLRADHPEGQPAEVQTE